MYIMIVGINKHPISAVFFTPRSMHEIPRNVEVMKIINPNIPEKITVIIVSRIKIEIESFV